MKEHLTKEYRIDVKVRNNVILYRIEKSGYKTVSEFCRLNGIMKYVGTLYDVINMKRSPLDPNGEFISCINDVSELLNCSPLDLFTDTQLNTILKSNKRSLQVNEAEMKFALENMNDNQRLLEDGIFEEQRNSEIESKLKTLSPREEKVLKMRMGLGEYDREHELKEIGELLDLSGTRIRQIEKKALRKLRHPSKSDNLKQYLEGKE